MSSASPEDDQSNNQTASSRSRVAATLRRDITSLHYEPGEGISDKQIAQELGISRTPVRESLILLEEEGLIEVYPRVGTFVTLVDLQRIKDAQFLREAIETESVIDFPNSAASVAHLRQILSQQETAVKEGDSSAFFELDEAFHRALMEQAGHGTAWKTVNSAKAHLDRARRLTLETATDLDDLVAQHRSIVDELEAGNRVAAADRLRGHLRAIYEDIQVIRRERPHLFNDLASQRENRRVIKRLQVP